MANGPVGSYLKPRSHYVYAMLCQDEAGGPGYVKFGHSGDIGTRLCALRVSCPIPARYFAVVEIGHFREQARQVERALHREFKDRKVSGEWFRFNFDSKEDKEAFNNGSRYVLQTVFENRYGWWTKISVKALDAHQKEKQERFLRSPFRPKIARKKQAQRDSRKAGRELSAYGA